MERTKIKLVFLSAALLLCALAFTACPGTEGGPGSPTVTEKIALSTPKNLKVLNTATDISLQWDMVSGADGYIVSVGDTVYKQQEEAVFSLKGIVENKQAGTYKLTVKAVPASGSTEFTDSSAAEYKEPDGGDFEPVKHIFEVEYAGSGAAQSVARNAAGGSCTITGLTPYARNNIVNIVIPEKIGDVTVTVIAADAFKGNTVMEKVVIAKTIVAVESGAFGNCTVLTEISFTGTAVPEIESNAFSGTTTITTIFVPESNEKDAFVNALKEVDGLSNAQVDTIKSITGVTISPKTLALELNKTPAGALSFTVAPEGAPNKGASWESSDVAVATVDGSGNVTAKGQGTATITITVTGMDGTSKTDTCTVTIKLTPVESVTLSDKNIDDLMEGNTVQLKAGVLPETAYNKELTWASSNENVAKVDADGKVTAVKQGTATVSATAKDGSGKKAECTVNVIAKPNNAPALIEAGINSLNRGEFDNAIATFELAYQADNKNPKAILYSTLGKLASIAVDEKVRTLVSKYVGIKDYPGEINTLITGDWISGKYTDEYVYDFSEYDSSTGRYTRYSWYEPRQRNTWLEDYLDSPAEGYYYETLKMVSDKPKLERKFIRSYYDTDDNWVYWYDYIGMEQEGYYKQYYYEDSDGNGYHGLVFISGEKQYPWEWSYEDEDGNSVQWYEANDEYLSTRYFNGGEVQEGYYVYDDYTNIYEFVTNQKRYVDEQVIIHSYRGENGNWVDWYGEDDWQFSEYGLTTPGYYTWAYALSDEPARYDTSTVTGFSMEDAPDWFKNTQLYQDSFNTRTGISIPTTATYSMLLVTNLLDKNTNGLNALLDDLLAAVMGDNFETAYARAKTLTESIALESSTLAAFGIDEVFESEGSLYVGPAELNALFAALRVFKASLEYVASYDWNTDLSFLKHGYLWDNLFENRNVDILKTYKPANLPFRNNFLKDRNNGMMAKSKADFNKAIDDAIAAYDAWISAATNLPPSYKNTLSEYQWIRDGFAKLKTAINSGATFHVPNPEYIQEGAKTYPAANADTDLFSINMGKFFTPGQIAIDKLISNDGNAPIFYGLKDYENREWVKITSEADIKNYKVIGFQFLSKPFTEVIPQLDWRDTTVEMLPPDIAEILWAWYH